ncbi:glycosyltransferase family 4 protein [Neomicrococcus lactis]|uniref:glycosyltransferase family 4 protein n=1 Tax=Neomicrococcus lactis TaxID=732241 RepID=UPI0023010EFF|nr:glycosyltransferase family 4 protein [Neomicrococcus lactis]
MVRLLLITHSYSPENTPPSRRWTAFTKALRDLGWDVDVVAPHPSQFDAAASATTESSLTFGEFGERIHRVPLLDFGTSRSGKLASNLLSAGLSVPVSLLATAPDVVAVTVPALPTIAAGFVASRFRNVPLIVDMRDAWPDLAREARIVTSESPGIMERVVSGVQKRADLVITVTQGFAEVMRARGSRRVITIPNGVHIHQLPALGAPDPHEGPLRVLYMGNHGESQNLKLLIDAAKLAGDDVHVRIVGQGTQKKWLQDYAASIDSPVEFLPQVDSAGAVEMYRWADTCVVSLRPDWPSFELTVPSKTYELLSIGRHITAIVKGEGANIIQEAQAGDVVPAEAVAVVELWQELKNDPSKLDRGVRGRAWVLENANFASLAQRFAHSVEELVSPQKVAMVDQSSTRSSIKGLQGTARTLARNAAVAARTVSQHVADDPMVLALQVSRRLPRTAVSATAKAGLKIFTADNSVPGALLRAIDGDEKGLATRLERVAQLPTDGSYRDALQRALLADAAVASGLPQHADRLLDGAPQNNNWVRAAVARRAAFRGDMDAAAQGRDERMAAELRVFEGSKLELPKQPNYRPLDHKTVHFLTNSLPHTGSGYAQRSHSILRSLVGAGWDVRAVTRIGYPVVVGKLLAQEEDRVGEVTYHRLMPPKWWGTTGNGLEEQLQLSAEMLLEYVLKERPAVLHTTTHFVNGIVVRAVAEAVGIPWVYEVRGQLADTWASTREESARESQRYKLFVEREQEIARSASAVVTLGAEMRDALIAQGVDPERIILCPNAVGGPFLEAPGTHEDARRALGLDPDAQYIGTISSIVGYEGLDDLVTAFAKVRTTNSRVKLLIVGDGVVLPALKRQAQELGVSGHCIFPGRVDRALAPTYHQAMNIFVVPRKDLDVTRNVTPLKPVEASASERPVIASNLPALRELVHDGDNGVTVPAEDPSALADEITDLLEDPARQQEMGRAGRAWVLADRTWTANAEKYDALYTRLTAQ